MRGLIILQLTNFKLNFCGPCSLMFVSSELFLFLENNHFLRILFKLKENFLRLRVSKFMGRFRLLKVKNDELDTVQEPGSIGC